VVAAPDYCSQHGVPRTPPDLEQHACITFGSGPTPNVWTLYAGEKTATVRVTPRLTVNEVDIMRDAARAGIGVAMLPDYACAAELRSGSLRRLLPSWSSPEVPVNAVYPTARHLSPKVAAFIALLGARLPMMTGLMRRSAVK
jgi:DNA-binding transcriptional LysR family regulator